MKFPFFKVLALTGAIIVAWNCSEETAALEDNLYDQNSFQNEPAIQQECWLLQNENLIIIPGNGAFVVTTSDGTMVGTYEIATGTIVNTMGEIVLTGLDLNNYPRITSEGTIVHPDGTITDKEGNLIYSPSIDNPIVVDPNTNPNIDPNANPDNPAYSSTNLDPITPQSSSSDIPTEPKSSSSEKIDTPKSSSSIDTPKSSAKQQNYNGAVTIPNNLDQTVERNQKIADIVFKNVQKEPQREWNIYFVQGHYDSNAKTYTLSGTVPDHVPDGKTLSDKYDFGDGSLTFTLTVGKPGTPKQSSSSQNQSSSSQKQSSSSQKQSSSSQKQSSSSQQPQGVTPNFQIKNGGRSGQGWGSRYWDCCMPHCAWGGNTGRPTRTCNSNMQEIGENGGSVCNGGQGGVCDVQAPFAVNDKLAYGFAAVPAGLGGECGKCFLLTFDGGSHNGGANANTGALNGKQMVVMVSNIGGDVGSNQFDIMIPGGGVGQFNGCGTQLGIASTGAQYGGYITDCNSNPNCVKEKCSAFSKYPKLQAGCEFSATWFNAANNPSFKFQELERCPDDLSSRW